MKSRIQYILQQLLGFERYLKWFAVFKVYTLKWDGKENDFFVFASMLPKKGIVLDVGANIGLMTHFLSERKEGAVIAVEPLPFNVKTIQYMQAKFNWKNVHLEQVAVGEKSGEVEMVLPEVDRVKKQGLSHVVHESITEFNAGKHMKVPMKTLDELVSGYNDTVVGIKMDVENYEYFALLGAHEILKHQRPIVYTELWDNENRKQCFNLMKTHGYSCNVVWQGKLTAFNPSVHTTQNFIFKP